MHSKYVSYNTYTPRSHLGCILGFFLNSVAGVWRCCFDSAVARLLMQQGVAGVWRHCFDDVVGGLKYSMNQKSDGKSSKFGEKLMKNSSKSRSGGGLGRSWCDFGALGRGLAALGLENLKKHRKKEKNATFLEVFWMIWGPWGV